MSGGAEHGSPVYWCFFSIIFLSFVGFMISGFDAGCFRISCSAFPLAGFEGRRRPFVGTQDEVGKFGV